MAGKRRGNTKESIVNEILMIKKTDQFNQYKPKNIRQNLLKMHKASLVPSERVIYNIIKKNKERLIFKQIDEAWTPLSLKKFPIPPEAVPKILRLWSHSRLDHREAITNRQVFWASMIYAFDLDDEEFGRATTLLTGMELESEILGDTVEDYELYTILLKNMFPDVWGKFNIVWKSLDVGKDITAKFFENIRPANVVYLWHAKASAQAIRRVNDERRVSSNSPPQADLF